MRRRCFRSTTPRTVRPIPGFSSASSPGPDVSCLLPSSVGRGLLDPGRRTKQRCRCLTDGGGGPTRGHVSGGEDQLLWSGWWRVNLRAEGRLGWGGGQWRDQAESAGGGGAGPPRVRRRWSTAGSAALISAVSATPASPNRRSRHQMISRILPPTTQPGSPAPGAKALSRRVWTPTGAKEVLRAHRVRSTVPERPPEVCG